MGPNAERLVKILDVIVYLFVDTYVPIVYRVMSSSTKSTTLAFTDIGFQKKKLSKWNRTPKGSSIFGNTRAYLLVDTCVPIMYRVMSSSTKSTTLAFTDIGFQKIFQNGTERRKARQFSVIREPIFSLVRL
jgi:hypothetical protein